MQDRMVTLEKKLAKVRSQLKLQEAKLTEVAEEAAKKVAALPAPKRRWVRSTRPGGKVHREASRPSDDTPSWRWTTGCSWKFGTSTFYEWVSDEEAKGLTEAALCDRGCDVWV